MTHTHEIGNFSDIVLNALLKFYSAKNHRLEWHLQTFKHHNGEEVLIFKDFRFYYVPYLKFKMLITRT
jgi:hypothetical protein